MLTQLSIRSPDRVPKGDHDKILKDHFFYEIRSDIHNSICHLYNDETVTSQHLVKACQNEEEDTISKLLNKSVVISSTLENRVDKLIERSNSQFNSGSNRVDQNGSCNYGRPPFQQSQRSRGDSRSNLQSSTNDIQQNLRGLSPVLLHLLGDQMAPGPYNALNVGDGDTQNAYVHPS